MREEQASSDLFELQGHYIQVSVEEIVAVLDPVRATWDERLEQLTLTMKDWEHLMRAQDAGVDLDESGSESGNNELAESEEQQAEESEEQKPVDPPKKCKRGRLRVGMTDLQTDRWTDRR